MKRSQKKRLLVQLFMVFILIAFVGCSGGKVDQGAEDQDGQQPVIEEAVSAEELLAKGAGVDEFSYDYVYQVQDGPKLTHKLWFKGSNMRSEMETPYGVSLSIINMEKKVMYIYDPQVKYALQMPIDPSEFENQSPKDFLEESDSSNMVFVSRELYDNKECLVYEFKDGESKGKMWIWEEGGMPLRVQSNAFTVEFLNFKIGDIDNSMFELPAGTEIKDMSMYQ